MVQGRKKEEKIVSELEDKNGKRNCPPASQELKSYSGELVKDIVSIILEYCIPHRNSTYTHVEDR